VGDTLSDKTISEP